MMDVWRRKAVAWDAEDCEDPKLAANLVNRACLREQTSKRRLNH